MAMMLSKNLGHPLVELKNINKINKSDDKRSQDSPTAELSQTMDDFQQQQTGRLLSVHPR